MKSCKLVCANIEKGHSITLVERNRSTDVTEEQNNEIIGMHCGVSFLPGAEGKRRFVTMAQRGELEWEPGEVKPYAQKMKHTYLATVSQL